MFGLPALRRVALWVACLGALCCYVSAASADVSLHVFRAKHADAKTISYKLHGLKGRSIVSARLRTRKGSKTVSKPVKLARKHKMHKAVVNESASGVIRLGSGSLPTTNKVLASSSAITVTRPSDIAPSEDPVLVVAVQTPASSQP